MIVKNGTVFAAFLNAFFVFLLGFLVATRMYDTGEDPAVVVFAAACSLVYFALSAGWVVYTNIRVNRRSLMLAELAARQGISYEKESATPQSVFALMSLREMRKARDKTFSNILFDKDWQYCDFTYVTYRRTKHGDYKAATHYYSVMTTQLPRSLPNVVFDSLKHRRRQFRFHFSKSQLHHLEGDFDKHFATYFPTDYTIDSMSFITPDVMWALREASDYDIEIVGNRLFLYGGLREPEAQINDMRAKLMNIKQQLLENILTYRDERLPADVGRQVVAPQAMELKRSNFWARVALATTILYLLAYLLPQLIRLFSR